MITNAILCEAFDKYDYITVNVYINGEYDHKDRIKKSLFPVDTVFYSGMSVDINLLNS